MEHKKNTIAINQNWFNIRSVAGTPDDVLEIFSKTPVYNLLKQRREFCRNVEKQLLTEELERMFEFYNVQIKQFFLI